MKAAICYEFGKPLVVEEIQIDAPQTGEVKVRIAATAICHSDVHLIRGDWGRWGGRPPIVVGHESAGVVEEVGPGVASVAAGQPVVVSLLRACGRCFQCSTGNPHMCAGAFALAKESRLHTMQGVRLRQGINTGSFAEYVVVDQSQVVPVPDDVSLDRAALLSCGVITGFGAVVNTARVRPGESVAVIGVGGVGVNALQGAALTGAYPIVALDILDTKLDSARAFGATHVFNAKDEAAVEKVKDLTGGRGLDYAFVTVGSPAAVSQALAMVRRGGAVVLVGMPAPAETASIPIADFAFNEQRVLGSNMGSARLSVDVPRLVEFYRNGRLKLDELITARFPLQQINEAIEAMERGEALRNVIVF